MKFGVTRKPLLLFCLSVSVVLHIGALSVLYLNPLSFSSSAQPIVVKKNSSSQPLEKEELLVEKIECALEESLNKVLSGSSSFVTHAEEKVLPPPVEKEKKLLKKISQCPKVHKEDLQKIEFPFDEFITSLPPLFDPQLDTDLAELALEDELEAPLITHNQELCFSIDFNTELAYQGSSSGLSAVEDDFTITNAHFSPVAVQKNQTAELIPQYLASLKTLSTSSLQVQEELSEEKLFASIPETASPQLILPNSVDYLRNQWIKRSLAEQKLPDLEYYGLDALSSDVSWEDNIQVDIALMPDPESNKYIFSMTIQPEIEASYKQINQNFYFLLDRSNSIDKNKFIRFKRALQRSLAALCEGDHFNIYIFDKKVSRLSDHLLSVNPKTIKMAEEFLEQQHSKANFAAADLYTTLDKLLPKEFAQNQLHSLILITDGNTLLNSSNQQKVLANWTKKLGGNVNCYAATAGKGNNLVLLDLLSYTTAGKMIYSDTNASFPRKLVRLIKDLHEPLIQNVTIDLLAEEAHTQASLYPSTQLLPPLFANQPYTIVGTVDELCDLTLFMQGRSADQWINIRKKISLKNAHKGGRSLEKLWSQARAKVCYENFLINGKSSYLKEAKQIVAPFHGAISMED